MVRTCILTLALAWPAVANEPVSLRQAGQPGVVTQTTLTLTVNGHIKVEVEGKPDRVPVAATANHVFTERLDAVTADGRPGRVVRHYTEARSSGETGAERSARTLGADRQVIVVDRSPTGTLHYALAGPLTQDEFALVGEHFDTLSLEDLLPAGPVEPGKTWPIPADAVQHLCQFDGVLRAELTGTLTTVTDTTATVTIQGTAEGLESGATVAVTVDATATVDRRTGNVTGLNWKQTDARGQGPASPAADLTATIQLTRTTAAAPAELASAQVPADGPTPLQLMLKYTDDRGRYSFVAPREWHVVGRTTDHLTLRLVEKGEFVAQATITGWKSSTPGSHSSPAEFKAALGKLPGWTPASVDADGEIPTDAGRWLYRVAATGTQDGVNVYQAFYLLASPEGMQVAVTVVCTPQAVARLGIRDVALVNGLELPARK